MSLKTEEATSKSINIDLNPGEIFVSFITDRKSNTDILLESYFNTVFPVAIQHGAVPLGNLIIDFTSRGNFNATDFIGISKWQNLEGASAFSEVFPEEQLNELRKPIWNNFKIIATPITENFSFKLTEGKVYEYKLLWGAEDEINQTLATIELYDGKILFDLPAVSYSDLIPETPPQRVALVEWSDHQQAFDYKEEQKDRIKEEAFYTFYIPSIAKEQQVHTNNLALEVSASADEVWQVLETAADVDKWFPYITSCELEENNGQLKRRCTTADGKTLEESIVSVDKENKVFVYSVDHHNMEIPVKNIRGIMRVKEKEEGAIVDWTVHFELMQQIEPEILSKIQNGMVESMRVGIKGIEAFLD